MTFESSLEGWGGAGGKGRVGVELKPGVEGPGPPRRAGSWGSQAGCRVSGRRGGE